MSFTIYCEDGLLAEDKLRAVENVLSDMVATGELSVESYERICAKNAEKIFDI